MIELIVKGTIVGLILFWAARSIWEYAYLKGWRDAADFFITEMEKAKNKKQQ